MTEYVAKAQKMVSDFGFLSGITSKAKNVLVRKKSKSYEDFFFGYPSLIKWKYDISRINKNKKNQDVVFALLELQNLEVIHRYAGYETGREAFHILLKRAKSIFGPDCVYAAGQGKMLISGCDKSSEEMHDQVERFVSYTKNPIYLNDISVVAMLRAGIAMMPGEEVHHEDVMKKLEEALDQANFSNSSVVVYSQPMAEERKKHYDILLAIYKGIHNNDFRLVYQPKKNMVTGHLDGVEALLRWADPDYSDLPIARVIQIAEDAGFISQITQWVLKTAIRQIRDWEKEGIQVKVAINLSARDLQDDALLDFAKECIAFYQIDPRSLEFELTERSVIEDEKNVFARLKKVREMGIVVSMDDYGTGHNSLMYLVNMFFQFDNVKIDKYFVDKIQNENTKNLIQGIILAAHGYGIKIIAEGVETEEQYKILQNIGCDVIQGYYYARPVASDRIGSYYKRIALVDRCV